jgi:exodeoxyribonuclease VII large subunit
VTQVGPGRAASPPHVFRVSEVMAGLRGLLADRVGRIWVSGEVSGLRRAASGHLYFTLKDESAQLRAVLFQGLARRLPFEPEEGLDCLVQGDVTVYEPRGDLQLLVQALEPRGQGALQLAFEQLRRRLEAEGLFDAARKRPLPAFPRTLGVVTAARGAALRDVIEVSARRFPAAPLLVAHARVQGEGAEAEIAAALAALDAREEVEVILLVRGGGSPEDLQPFNTEVVARAIAVCRTPVVSGVGHEIDVTIADLAADLRAPTPSAAAAAALPDRSAVALRVERDLRRLRAGVARALERARARLGAGGDALRVQAPWARVAARRLRLEAAVRALRREAAAAGERGRARLAALAGRLESLSPLAVLGRGYAIARRRRDGAILRRASEVAAGDTVAVRLAEGEFDARVLAPGGRSPRG